VRHLGAEWGSRYHAAGGSTMAETRVVVPEPEAPRRTGRRGAPLRRGRTVHYTDAEWEAVREAAQQCGKAARRFVRDASLGALPTLETFRADAELIRELRRAGNALVRLAATRARERRAARGAPVGRRADRSPRSGSAAGSRSHPFAFTMINVQSSGKHFHGAPGLPLGAGARGGTGARGRGPPLETSRPMTPRSPPRSCVPPRPRANWSRNRCTRSS
jgi:mobilization protein NikA